ncbi:MAG: hypothetical protein K8S18_16200 [Desulfobacula sp.]|nr:hypothetical protein [Desulfobacula sp.]
MIVYGKFTDPKTKLKQNVGKSTWKMEALPCKKYLFYRLVHGGSAAMNPGAGPGLKCIYNLFFDFVIQELNDSWEGLNFWLSK